MICRKFLSFSKNYIYIYVYLLLIKDAYIKNQLVLAVQMQ